MCHLGLELEWSTTVTHWFHAIDDEDNPDEVTVIPETPPESDNDSDTNDGGSEEASLDEIEQKVTFKCIGFTKEQPYKQALKFCAAHLHREGNDEDVKVEPEPTNPFDAKPIQIKCKDVEKDRLFGVRGPWRCSWGP